MKGGSLKVLTLLMVLESVGTTLVHVLVLHSPVGRIMLVVLLCKMVIVVW